MKLIKKLLPMLAIVPTISALSTSFSSCSKNESNSCTQNEKLCLAEFEEIVFKAKISTHAATYPNVISMQNDLIKICKQQKSDAYISSLIKAASNLANLENKIALDDAKIMEFWNGVKSHLNKQSNDNKLNILAIYNHFFDKLLENPAKAKDKVDYLWQLAEDGINCILDKKISSDIKSYFVDLTCSALDNTMVEKDEDYPDDLCEIFNDILDFLKQNFPSDGKIWGYITPIFSMLLENAFFQMKMFVTDTILPDIENTYIPKIKEYLENENEDLANAAAGAIVSYLKKPAWATLEVIFNANRRLLNNWLSLVLQNPKSLKYAKALEEMGKSVFANLLTNNNIDASLESDIDSCINAWVELIRSVDVEEDAMVLAKWAGAQFMLDNSTLYENKEALLGFQELFITKAKEFLKTKSEFGSLFVDATHEFSLFYKDCLTLLDTSDDISEASSVYLAYLKAISSSTPASVTVDLIKNSSEIMKLYIDAFNQIKDEESKEGLITNLNGVLKTFFNDAQKVVIDKQMTFLSKDLVTYGKNTLITANKLIESAPLNLEVRLKWLETFTSHIFDTELAGLVAPTKPIGPEQIPLAQLTFEYIYSTAALNWWRNSVNMRPYIEILELNQVFLNYVEYDDIILGYEELYKNLLSCISTDNWAHIMNRFNAIKEKLAVVLINESFSKKWKDILEIAANTVAAYAISANDYHDFITNNFDKYYESLLTCGNTTASALNKISAILADDKNGLEVDLSLLEEFASCFTKKVEAIETLTNKENININIGVLSSWYKVLHNSTSKDQIDNIEAIYKSELKKIISLK